MEQYKSPEKPKESGLDMKETIEWYEKITTELPTILADLPHVIENQKFIELSEKELGGLLSMFPKNALNRSILRNIVGQPTNWFHKNSTNEQPVPTTEKNEALSPTSIIPSYIDYTPWGELKIPTADIWLYEIPDDIAPINTKKKILSEGFIHEIGHSIVQPALYINDYNLKFPDGTLINGADAILNFAKLAEKYPPISHYASTYRGKNNKFESDNPDYNKKTAISEELCEVIAAYLLGFSYCGKNSKDSDPLEDRPEIKTFVRNFLDAELVK